jgi:hypothetical protein
MINKNILFTKKYPKLSDYKVKLFSPIFMLAVIPIAMMYLYSLKEITTDYLVQIILFFPILYLLATMLNMIFKIDVLLIRIINVCEENLNRLCNMGFKRY